VRVASWVELGDADVWTWEVLRGRKVSLTAVLLGILKIAVLDSGNAAADDFPRTRIRAREILL